MIEAKKFHLLMTDDSYSYAASLKKGFDALQSEIQFTHLEDGEDLITYLKKEKKPDLIVLDINMVRMNGVEALKIIKGDNTLKTIPVLIMSSMRNSETISTCYAQGANAFIPKPFDQEGFNRVAQAISIFWIETARI